MTCQRCSCNDNIALIIYLPPDKSQHLTGAGILDIEGADVIKHPYMTLTDKTEITHGDVREDETILCGISWMT
jgi:hypothetical protein